MHIFRYLHLEFFLQYTVLIYFYLFELNRDKNRGPCKLPSHNAVTAKHSSINWPQHSIFFITSALLQNPVAETLGQDSQNVRRLQCAETENVFLTARGRCEVRYATSVFAVCTKQLYAALCSTVYGASSVAMKLYSECYCDTPL